VMFHADTAKGNATQATPSGEIDAEGRYDSVFTLSGTF